MTEVVATVLNSTSIIFGAVTSYLYGFSNILFESLGTGLNLTLNYTGQENIFTDISHTYFNVLEWFAYDDFQIKLLKAFAFILLSNIFFIFISWKVYGKRISEKFMRPPTSKSIEDLRKSVSLLKLPKEHSPRV